MLPRLGAPSAEAGGMFDAGRDVAAYLERLLALPRAEAIRRVRKIADEYVDTTSALCSLEHSQLDNSEKNRGMSASREVLYVDKQLDNHAHVAIIRAALPAAKIVWCARDARDVGLSQFFHAFEAEHNPVPNSNLQLDFNVSVCDSFDATSSASLRELDESNRFVQKSAESTSI